MPQGSSVDAEAAAVGKLVPNLFRAHARARRVIRGKREGAKVGVNPLVTGFPTWLQMLMDWGACHRRMSEALFKFTTGKPLVRGRGEVDLVGGELTPQGALRFETKMGWLNWAWRFWGTTSLIANANWWYLGIKGKLAEELCPDEAIGAQDFVGLDYYWGLPTWRLNRFRLLEEAAHGRFIKAPVWARGLFHALRRFHRWFPDQDLLIVENGCPPSAGGISREEYMRLHLREVEQALAKRVPVKAYIWWSITSNREWGHAFDPNTDFGLYFIDLDKDAELKRVATPELGTLARVIAEAGG